MDFSEPVPERITRVIEFRALQCGTVHGIAPWFNATLVPGLELGNEPDRAGNHWPQAFITFHAPLTVQRGGRYPIELTFRQHAPSQHGITMTPPGQ